MSNNQSSTKAVYNSQSLNLTISSNVLISSPKNVSSVLAIFAKYSTAGIRRKLFLHCVGIRTAYPATASEVANWALCLDTGEHARAISAFTFLKAFKGEV